MESNGLRRAGLAAVGLIWEVAGVQLAAFLKALNRPCSGYRPLVDLPTSNYFGEWLFGWGYNHCVQPERKLRFSLVCRFYY